MTKGTGDGGVKRHHAHADLAQPPGPGESAPAMDVTPSQVVMEVVVPPPSAETSSGGPEGGVMATQAMPTSPGRHVGGEGGSAASAPAAEASEFDFTDHPPTPEEVAPQEWPRPATTPPPLPPPASEGNGVRILTSQDVARMIREQVSRAVRDAVGDIGGRFHDITKSHDKLAEEFGRFSESLGTTINGVVNAAKAATLEEADRTTDGRLVTFWRKLHESLDERLRNLAGQQEDNIGRVQDDLGKVMRDLDGEIRSLRNDVGTKASREEVDSLSGTIGSLRSDVAGFRESIDGLKSADSARADTMTTLAQQVAGFSGTMATFEGRVGAFAKDTDDARRELEELRQADTNLNAGQTKLAARVRGIEQALEELKGALRGIREETLPDVRKAAVRAEQAAAAASAQMAELIPRLEYVEGLATKMRGLQNFMDQVGALERWRIRHSADIADVAVQVGLNELAEDLRGTLPRQ